MGAHLSWFHIEEKNKLNTIFIFILFNFIIIYFIILLFHFIVFYYFILQTS